MSNGQLAAIDIADWDRVADAYAASIGGPEDRIYTMLRDGLWSSLGPDVGGLDILDLGCGHGWLSALLAAKGARVRGIDGSMAYRGSRTRLLHVRYILAAASFLLLATGCDAGKAPRAHALGAAQQPSPATTESSVADAEGDYVSAKRTYLASLDAEKKRGTPDSVVDAHEAAALRDLAGRLRKVVGPFKVEGFADSGTSNLTTLVPQMDFGAIDGIAYHSSDSITVVVTTHTLLDAWLRDPVAGDTTLPRDLASALARTALYERGIPQDVAVLRYAEIPVNHAAKSGVVAAMLVARAQDIGPFTPGQVIVSAMRGNRVYLVEAPASALIEPMAPCVGIWSEVAAKRDINIEAGQRATDTTARDSDFRIADKLEWQGDTLVRQCYAEHVTADPRFAALAQQVESIARRLPPE